MVALAVIGYSRVRISRFFQTSHQTISKILNAFEERHGPQCFLPKPRSGGPPKLNEAEKRYIIQQTKRNRQISWNALLGTVTASGRVISLKTIQRVVRSYWKRKWRAVRRIKLTEALAAKRLKFTREWLPKVDELNQVRT